MGAEIELIGAEQRERYLANVLAPVAGQYDYVLVDCPPSLGILTLNALVAADGIVVPMQAEYAALEDLSALTATIEKVRRRVPIRSEKIGGCSAVPRCSTAG